ncbi:hypothetical protein BC2230_10954 [Burkholderia cepacia]
MRCRAAGCLSGRGRVHVRRTDRHVVSRLAVEPCIRHALAASAAPSDTAPPSAHRFHSFSKSNKNITNPLFGLTANSCES